MGSLVMPLPAVASEPTPRMRTTGAAPVIAPGSTTTPGICATISVARLVIGMASTRPLTFCRLDTTLPSSTLRCSPVAVVTICDSWKAAWTIAKSSVTASPAVTVIGFLSSS